jgi:tetratricopeptide (TPR) repeat protein
METLQKYCLSICILCCLFSCKTDKEDALEILEYGKYNQGSAQSLNALTRALELDSTNAEAYRELSIPYLKRGIPNHWKTYMDQAVILDSLSWIGYRGYNYLWFYRDYKKAITDFDATDTLTPNFVDAPQGHSVDYWRGIAYLGLNDYEQSITYFDKYINKEIEESGEDWVELTAFLYRGIAYFETGDYDNAMINFDKQLQYSRNLSADAKYYKSRIFKEQGNIEDAKLEIDSAIDDFNIGYFDNRPYVESIRQIYMEDLTSLKSELEQ